MAPRNKQTKKTRGQMRGVTRKVVKGKVLDVRSPKDIKAFERLVVNGPLTLVYINAKWCGACHQFTDKVWNHLINIKNKKMNTASVDSEMVGKIPSLANIPRKFYPTLLLVGNDKKPATFLDEEGNRTAAMPRNASLEEDREAFSSLVQNPTLNLEPSVKNSAESPEMMNMMTTVKSAAKNTAESPEMMNMMTTVKSAAKNTAESPELLMPTMTTAKSSAKNTAESPEMMPTMTTAKSSAKNTAESPEMLESVANSELEPSLPPEAVASQPRTSMKSRSRSNSRNSKSPMSEPIRLRQLSPFPNSSKMPSMLESTQSKMPAVPNVASDMRNMTAAEPLRGGNLLKAINAHTASLKALLKLRSKQ